MKFFKAVIIDLRVYLFSVFTWRTALLFPKQSAEIQLIVIANNRCNLVDGILCGFKQDLCIVDSEGQDELHRCLSGVFPETANKPAHAHTSGTGICINVDIPVVIFIKVSSCKLHFSIQIFIFRDMFVL